MFYRDNSALLCLFSHVSSCFHDRPSDNPHMLHSNKTIQFLPLASLPWQPDSFLEPTFLLAYIPQSRGRRPIPQYPELSSGSIMQKRHPGKPGVAEECHSRMGATSGKMEDRA